jgi:hypothetical protein
VIPLVILTLPHCAHVISRTWIFNERCERHVDQLRSILSVAHRWRKMTLAVRFWYKVTFWCTSYGLYKRLHVYYFKNAVAELHGNIIQIICMLFYNKSMIVYCELRVLSCTEVCTINTGSSNAKTTVMHKRKYTLLLWRSHYQKREGLHLWSHWYNLW